MMIKLTSYPPTNYLQNSASEYRTSSRTTVSKWWWTLCPLSTSVTTSPTILVVYFQRLFCRDYFKGDLINFLSAVGSLWVDLLVMYITFHSKSESVYRNAKFEKKSLCSIEKRSLSKILTSIFLYPYIFQDRRLRIQR